MKLNHVPIYFNKRRCIRFDPLVTFSSYQLESKKRRRKDA